MQELPPLLLPTEVGIDTETTGLDWPRDSMFGFSIAWDCHTAYFDIREQPEALSWLKDAIRHNPRTHWVFFNITFDLKMFWSMGVEFPLERCHCTSINACCINEHLGHAQYTLDSLSQRYLGEGKYGDIYQDLADIFGGQATKGVQIRNLQQAPPEVVAPYAEVDAQRTLQLYQGQQALIDEQNLHQVIAFEESTIPRVFAAELRGVRVDVERAQTARQEIHEEIYKHQRALDEMVGRPFNVNSSPQIKAYYEPYETGDGWFLKDGSPCATTPKGNASIDKDVLQARRHFDPVADKIIEIRSLIRTADTFLGKHILGSAVETSDGYYVYPNINQAASEEGGTKTGRFSYTGPALQQIPNRNKVVAAIVKACFLPDPGHKWLDGDLNSFEVRVFGHLVGAYNPHIAEVYAANPETDFHQYVADLMGVPRNPQPEGGANAKQLDLSMIFNSGNGAIAEKLGYDTIPASFTNDEGDVITYKKPCIEAQMVIDEYHRNVPGVKTLATKAKETALSRGYIKTMYGRHLRLESKRLAYKMSGILIQATAGDLNKDNWRLIDEALDDRGRMLLNTHDSYSMSVEEGREKEVWKDVKQHIETAERPHKLRVPLVLDYNGCGPNWWGALQG